MALVIEQITVRFGKNTVLKEANATFEAAQIHGIAGFNGSGKTTLFKTILGHLTPNEGAVSLNGDQVDKQKISHLPTQNFFYDYLTGQEYLNIFPTVLGKEAFDLLSSVLNLPLDELVEGYSSGMKKKLAFLAILKLNREVYLLDEPFNGLDLESVLMVKKVLMKLKEAGKTILVTSHIPETLVNLCDTFHFLENGHLKLVAHEEYTSSIEEAFEENFGKEMEQKLKFE